MVKLTQDIQAAFEVETTYGNPPDTELYHLGLLDTFDPRQVEMNITPVPSIGQSTDSHHASGPIDVTLPIKVACQGTGWQELLGNAIGKTDMYSAVDVPHALTSNLYSHAIVAKDLSTNHYTLCTGVVANEATLQADYTAGGYMTLEAACTALYSEDSDTGDFTFNDNDTYNSIAFPNAPSSEPLLPSNLTLSFGADSDPLSTTNFVIKDADAFKITEPSVAGKYVEVGERYMRFFTEDDNADGEYATSDNDAIVATGVIDLTHTNVDTLTKLKSILNTAHSGTPFDFGTSAGSHLSVNMLKGIYKLDAGSQILIPAIGDTTANLTEFTNLKTVSMKIANNNTPIPGKTDGIWLQNANIGRGKADITLDITMTADNEDLYDLYTRKIPLALVRLDFGTDGSIALTNGTITSFSRPLAGGGEIVDTLSIKFRGNGNYRNYSAFAISTDFTLQ